MFKGFTMKVNKTMVVKQGFDNTVFNEISKKFDNNTAERIARTFLHDSIVAVEICKSDLIDTININLIDMSDLKSDKDLSREYNRLSKFNEMDKLFESLHNKECKSFESLNELMEEAFQGLSDIVDEALEENSRPPYEEAKIVIEYLKENRFETNGIKNNNQCKDDYLKAIVALEDVIRYW
jgi:hypothetical protein